MTAPRLDGDVLAELDTRLAAVDERLRHAYPGDPGGRQPVHTAYVPADRYTAGVATRWGERARAALDEHAPDAAALAAATRTDPATTEQVWPLLLAKLDREPVEDLRVDFEDGYGNRPDAEEDAAATTAAAALATDPARPPYTGIRVKSLEAGTRHRGVRTLDLVLAGLLAHGPLPAGFAVTLPKVSAVGQVEAMVWVCEQLEHAYGLPAGTLRFEVQIETPPAVLGADGTALVARMVHAAAGRCTGLHYGTYDYSAACGIAAAYQSMEHPVADHAKAVMQLATAGTGVRVSDGSTNVLPVGERGAVHAGWALHARLVRRSLERGFYQGWDLHPAQLPTRYLATYAFYREGLTATAGRLAAYVAGAESGVLDEPATARALAGYLLRGLQCGALTAAEVTSATGLDLDRTAALARNPAPPE